MAIDLGQKSRSIGNSAETTPHYAARLPERHDPIARPVGALKPQGGDRRQTKLGAARSGPAQTLHRFQDQR